MWGPPSKRSCLDGARRRKRRHEISNILKFTLGMVEEKMRLQAFLSVIFISQTRGEHHDGINMDLIPNLGILENLDPRG